MHRAERVSGLLAPERQAGLIDQHNEAWFDVQVEAEVRFKHTGELPRDELHRECVLVSVELDLLWRHKRGRDVTEAMALLARVARRNDEGWEQALKELCEMAKSGRLRSPAAAS